MLKNVLSVTAAFVAVTAVLAFPATTASAESTQKLTDDADILYYFQEDAIEENLNECTQKTGWDTVIYTNNNGISSYRMEDYCNDYFDNHDYGCGDDKSGVLLTIDMNSREMYIITKGEAMYYFSDSRMDDLLDSVQYELSDGDYKGACDEFVETVEYYYNIGKDTGSDAAYNNVEIAESTRTFAERVSKCLMMGSAFLLFGILLGAVIGLGIRHSYKKNGKGENYDLARNSSLNLTESYDQFLYKNVTSVSMSSSSSSHGGHSSHSSHRSHRSHSSHGGGGRHF